MTTEVKCQDCGAWKRVIAFPDEIHDGHWDRNDGICPSCNKRQRLRDCEHRVVDSSQIHATNVEVKVEQ